MSESAKEILDLRFAKGEISEEEYRRMARTIQVTADPQNRTSPSRNETRFPASSGPAPFEVTPDFVMHEGYFVYKRQKIPYAEVRRLDYTAFSYTLNLVNNSIYSMVIHVDGMKPITVKSTTMFIGQSQKGKRISDAYALLSKITFQQRLASHLNAMRDIGYTTIEGVRLYPNGDVVQGGTKANIKEAAKNNHLALGTYFSAWWSMDSSSDPYEIIIGNNGTNIFSSRVKFKLTQNQDVESALLEHLAK